MVWSRDLFVCMVLGIAFKLSLLLLLVSATTRVTTR